MVKNLQPIVLPRQEISRYLVYFYKIGAGCTTDHSSATTSIVPERQKHVFN